MIALPRAVDNWLALEAKYAVGYAGTLRGLCAYIPAAHCTEFDHYALCIRFPPTINQPEPQERSKK